MNLQRKMLVRKIPFSIVQKSYRNTSIQEEKDLSKVNSGTPRKEKEDTR